MNEQAEELRIIAQDAKLSVLDRQKIVSAADEMDDIFRRLLSVQIALIESQAHRIAVNERMLEMKRAVSYQLLPVINAHWPEIK